MPGVYEAVGTAGISVTEALAAEPDLDKLQAALIREQVIRSAMADTGEPREIVVEMIDALESMGQEAVLDLMEGEPTTLQEGLERYVRELEGKNATNEDAQVIVGELTALLMYPWPGPCNNPCNACSEG